jgi:glycosyltransferase involved in cell wall biosynthesis
MGHRPSALGPISWLLAIPGRLLDRGSAAILEACVRQAKRNGDQRLESGRGRTLWGITPILTLPLKARCDEVLGFKSETLVFTTYYTARNFTWNLQKLIRVCGLWPRAERPLCRIILGVALLRYDIFNTFADRGLMPSRQRFGVDPEELDALARAGKRLYVYGYGADVRTREATLGLGAWNFCRDCVEPGRHCICDDKAGASQMAQLANAATAIVSQGDMLTYMPGARHSAYWPIDTLQITRTSPEEISTGTVRIAHAPNHTHFKGTRYLEQSVARLAARGIAIELVQVTGVANEQVLELFASCHLVADQFIGGAYGYAALEAMASSKPVLTYVRDPGFVVAPDECPLINATPDTLDEVLEWCAANQEHLTLIGRQGRAYVERHHSIPAVAARFARTYLDTARLPRVVNEHLSAFIAAEAKRCASVSTTDGWRHPFAVAATFAGGSSASEKRRA